MRLVMIIIKKMRNQCWESRNQFSSHWSDPILSVWSLETLSNWMMKPIHKPIS